MPIPVSCSGCSARLNAPDNAAGKAVRCPKCKATVAVPAPVAEYEVGEDDPPASEPPKRKPVPAAEDESPAAPPRRRESRDDDDEPPAARKKRPANRDDDEDEEEDRPRRKRRAEPAGGGSSKVLIAAVAGVLLLAGGGFAVYWFAIRETPTETAGTGTGTGTAGTPDAKNPNPKGPKDPNSPNNPPDKSNIPNWAEFSNPQFAFKAAFPWRTPSDFQLPGPYPQAVNLSETRSFTVARRQGNNFTEAFGVSALRFRGTPSEAERQKAGDDYFNRIPIPSGGKRSEAKAATLAGRPAKEFVTESREGGKTVHAHARLLVTEASIYVVTVRDAGALTPADVAKFFDSFEVLPDTAPKPPDPKKTDPKEPPPSLPPTPPGWVPFSDFGKRYEGQIPPGGQTMVTNGRLAYLKDVGKGKIAGGLYNEVAYPDKGLTVSMRVLVFDLKTTPEERAEVLDAYVKRLAEAGGYVSAPVGAKWGNLDAKEETVYAPEYSQVRRSAVAGSQGLVLTLRGTKRPEFDELKATLFDNVLPRAVQSGLGERVIKKGWEDLSSDAGLFRVDMPATPAPAVGPDKILADAKLDGEFYQGVSVKDGSQEVYVAGYVKYPPSATAADRKRVRDQLLAALKPPGAADKKPLILPSKPPRQIAWEEYQWLGKGDPEGGVVRFHESDNTLRVLAARGKNIRDSQNRVSFIQFFELLR